MTHIAIFWDAAPLWGLLVWRAAETLGLPYRLVKAQEIAHGTLSDKTSLLVVPGGTARHKAEALGPAGRSALRDWVQAGGNYVGFCGGAGLGLSESPVQQHARRTDPVVGEPQPSTPTSSDTQLGLCPWQRAEIGERVQHLVSGPVRVALNPEHPLSPQLNSANPECPHGWLEIPVWWPGRFAAPEEGQKNFQQTGVDILARYGGPNPRDCPPDLCVADLPLRSLSADVLQQWKEVYGVALTPSFLGGQPCVVHGRYGQGSYTLSYSHLETPDSPDANRWLVHLIRALAGIESKTDIIPPWHLDQTPLQWEDPTLLTARQGMATLIQLGLEHGLLYTRTPWLTGWRSGVPGSGLNSLYMALCVLTGCTPTPEAQALLRAQKSRFLNHFTLFKQGVENLLLALRLATIAPEAVPRSILEKQRLALFGSAMQGGGLYKELLDAIDSLLFSCLTQKERA